MALFSARGLSNFISEIRSCTNAEDEQKRIDKELNKLRQKFTQTGQLNSYDKKKYAWKLIYIYMLGYDIDFGHMQVLALTQTPTGYKSLIEVVIERLAQLVHNKSCPRDYMYYSTPCPWLQIKLLRILQQFGAIEDVRLNEKLNDTLRKILGRPSPGKGAKNNAIYAVLFETVNLVIAQGKRADPKLHEQGIQLLARFISVSEPNIRYIGLDSMNRLVRLEGASEAIRQHKATVIFSLKDADNSVRRRALDLLFAMCDHSNALEIVGELVTYLAVADSTIRDEIVLKAAILAERYAKDLRWYVDTVLQLITIAGADVPDDVWHRVVQIVTNNEDLQKYTAQVMFRALEPKHVDETTAKFGFLNVDEPDMSSTRQFDVLLQHYTTGSIATKCLILTAFIKMDNLFEEIRPRILDVFKKGTSHVDLEAQQRACEYFTLHHSGDDIMKNVLEPMPVFPDTRESNLVVRLRAQQKAAEGGDEAAASPDERDSAATPAPHGGNDDSSDLLGLSSPTNHNQQPRQGNDNGVGDVFRGKSNSGVDPNKLAAWFNKIVATNQGVLFENDVIQIGVKQEFRGSQGRLGLFYGNKSSQPLTGLSLNVKNVPSLRTQVEEVAKELAPKQQLKQQVMVECMQPFIQPAEAVFTYTSGSQQTSLDLKLPCVATSFLEPVKLGLDDFHKPDVSGSLSMAATFRTGTSSPSGEKISVGILVKLESQGNSYRVTVRAVHPDVSVAVKNNVKLALA
ncbi:hypothetical protein DYB32_006334 [Aphanomyces invadans]|uniref:Clathrin adaptor alpha/beta/gamma-adaptin appendage Ig-like subdomain domain-containing protein n=1 Tax=Aphanomyces invadans TaxID=157072 RepID=A0A3R6VV52_9STRA|nr:hypothetical protein DYB32_006334 [Aphanomyces invadans]